LRSFAKNSGTEIRVLYRIQQQQNGITTINVFQKRFKENPEKTADKALAQY